MSVIGHNEESDEFAAMEDDLFASDKDGSDGEDRRVGGGSGSGSDNGNANNNDDGKTTQAEKRKIDPKKPKTVKRILLTEDMVCGKNGLIKLDELFKDFKLQGRGHELQDINSILYKLEHWIHILHPKYQFAQTLERIEFLGLKKRSIKTYLKKIRMGLISFDTNLDEANLPDFDLDMSDIDMEMGHREERLTEFPEHHTTQVNDNLFDDDDEGPPIDPEADLNVNVNINPNPPVTMSDDDDEWILNALQQTEAEHLEAID